MLKVCKFGGSSLADGGQVKKVCDIVLADPARRIVVVSAPGKRSKQDTKVTDLLIDCANRALANKDPEPALREIVDRYAEIQRTLGLEAGIVAEIDADLPAAFWKWRAKAEAMEAVVKDPGHHGRRSRAEMNERTK